MYPHCTGTNNELLYRFTDNQSRLRENENALDEVKNVYILVNKISDQYDISMSSIIQYLYYIDICKHPIDQKMLDALDTVA